MSEATEQLYFIIGGGGQVGYFLARDLLNNGFEDVVLLERDARRVRALEDALGGEVVVRGDACEARTLESIGCYRADYMIAVTGDDEDNLVMCQVARVLAGPKLRTIARVNNIANIDLFDKLGISKTISLTHNILGAIEAELPIDNAISLHSHVVGGLQLTEIVVPSTSPAQGRSLRALGLPPNSRIVLIQRGKDEIWPEDTTVLAPGDRLVASVNREGYTTLARAILGTGSR